MHKTILDPNPRALLQIKSNHIDEVNVAFEAFMGSGLDTSKNSVYIETTYKLNTSFEDQSKSITRASNNVWDKSYDEVERDNTLVIEKAYVPTVPTLIFTNLAPVECEVELDPVLPEGYNEEEMGALSYEIALDNQETEASITDGKVSGAKQPGTVKVTADGGTKYGAGSFGEYDVTFTVVEPSPSLLSFTDPEAGTWGQKSKAPTIPDTYNEENMGTLEYALDDKTTQGMASDEDEVITIDKEGRVSYLKEAGSVKVIVSITGGKMYSAGDIGTYTVEFTNETVPPLKFTDPDPVEWGQSSKAQEPEGFDATMGTITYSIKGPDSTDAQIIEATGVVSNAKQSGTVIVQANISESEHYEGGLAGEYSVVFAAQDAQTYTFEDKENAWTEESEAQEKPTGYLEAMGTIKYKVTANTGTGGTLQTNGSINDATGPVQ